LVQSLAHPGGNVTGISIQQLDLVGKRLELLREAIPQLHRLAILADAGYAEPMLEADRVKSTAQEFNSTDYQDAQKIGQNYAHYNIIAVNGVKQ
jgi:ABC-type uncharacterized transport system substrate-binding protein